MSSALQLPRAWQGHALGVRVGVRVLGMDAKSAEALDGDSVLLLAQISDRVGLSMEMLRSLNVHMFVERALASAFHVGVRSVHEADTLVSVPMPPPVAGPLPRDAKLPSRTSGVHRASRADALDWERPDEAVTPLVRRRRGVPPPLPKRRP